MEQEVLELVENQRVDTEPLRDMYAVGSFEESMLGGKDDVFISDIGDVDNVDNLGCDTHATTGGSFVTPADASESFDLFAKLQDEEAMDALDPTKEPPVDWEPGPEDEVDVEAMEHMAHTRWDELHDGLGIVVADLESSARVSLRKYRGGETFRGDSRHGKPACRGDEGGGDTGRGL